MFSLRAFLPPLLCCVLTCRRAWQLARWFTQPVCCLLHAGVGRGANGLPACMAAIYGRPTACLLRSKAPHAKPAHQWRNDSPLRLGNKKAVVSGRGFLRVRPSDGHRKTDDREGKEKKSCHPGLKFLPPGTFSASGPPLRADYCPSGHIGGDKRELKILEGLFLAFERMGEGDCWNSIVQGALVKVSPKMLVGRASTFPPSSDRQPRTPRASSEHEARSEPRTSISDEAQACFNLVLILRNDTQYLISLRNDSLQSFEEIDTARPLLSQINSAITAATRSIHELGPFLERHRWPPCEPPRASIIRLKILRKRSRSLSSSVSGGAAAAAAADPGLSPDELFSWTLALTTQHTAVLAALDQLERFLVYGSADISEDDRRRHDATGSWWQQRHSEFENVTLIQSILQRPRRNLKGLVGATVTTPAADMAESAQIGIAVTSSSPAAAPMMPYFTEHDDGRSETLTFSEQSIRSWPGEINGLTARPRARNESTPDGRLPLTYTPLDLRIMPPGPAAYPQPSPPAAMQTEPPLQSSSEQEKEARHESRGAEGPLTQSVAIPELPLSRFNSSIRRPRITTTPLPPLVGLQALIPDISQRARSATLEPHHFGHAVSPLSPSSPMLSPPGLSRHSSRVSLPSPVQASPAVDTPFTPLNQQVATMFEQQTLPSKTIQPVIQELDNLIASPVYSMQPVFELDVSPVANSHYTQSPTPQEDDKHWPYLAYMARKQAVTMSRWSVRRSRSTKSRAASDS